MKEIKKERINERWDLTDRKNNVEKNPIKEKKIKKIKRKKNVKLKERKSKNSNYILGKNE